MRPSCAALNETKKRKKKKRLTGVVVVVVGEAVATTTDNTPQTIETGFMTATRIDFVVVVVVVVSCVRDNN